jgi:hypothetical protein
MFDAKVLKGAKMRPLIEKSRSQDLNYTIVISINKFQGKTNLTETERRQHASKITHSFFLHIHSLILQ